MKDVIRLITTKGCEGCEILKNLLDKAIKKSTFTNIKVEVIDCLDINYRQFINRFFISDYPTMVFMRNDQTLTKFTGTMPVDEIVNNIKYWYGKD